MVRWFTLASRAQIVCASSDSEGKSSLAGANFCNRITSDSVRISDGTSEIGLLRAQEQELRSFQEKGPGFESHTLQLHILAGYVALAVS